MARQGTHYEQAFAAYLQQRGIAHVAVDQGRKALIAGARLKSFDFILTPRRGRRILVDVKGRKCPSRRIRQGRLGPNWATSDDISGLEAWEDVFGQAYLAALVFAWWLVDEDDSVSPGADPQPDVFCWQDRRYHFAAVDLQGYKLWMRPRSSRWQTVHVPTGPFARLAWPLRRFV